MVLDAQFLPKIYQNEHFIAAKAIAAVKCPTAHGKREISFKTAHFRPQAEFKPRCRANDCSKKFLQKGEFAVAKRSRRPTARQSWA